MAEPYVLEREQLAKAAPERWRKQYESYRNDPDKTAKTQVLLSLSGSNLNADAVDEIIGNASWTSIHCDGCGEYVHLAVVVGAPMDYESATATLCKSCLEKAMKVIAEAEALPQPPGE